MFWTHASKAARGTVLTYILGGGDRHLDNLLLHPTGHFFHCDYSFILGHDPKKYLPLRISEDMVNGMGGRESDNYAKFLSLTCASFLTFRRPENVRHLMSFVRLMDGCSTDSASADSKLSVETTMMGYERDYYWIYPMRRQYPLWKILSTKVVHLECGWQWMPSILLANGSKVTTLES